MFALYKNETAIENYETLDAQQKVKSEISISSAISIFLETVGFG